MKIRRLALLTVLASAAGIGCVHRFVPAPFGTPLDQACNPTNGNLNVPLDTFELGPAIVPVTKGWTSQRESIQDLMLTRLDAELDVWHGGRFQFSGADPQNSVRCSVRRGDTTISIQATRLNGFAYRVEASWEPLIDGQYFYMQLQTRYVEHLKLMRGMIEAVRFPPDTVTRKK
jgi:hypothetical protein